MKSEDLVSMGFSAMLDERAEKALETLLEWFTGEEYLAAQKTIDAAMDLFTEAKKGNERVDDAYLVLEAAYNHITSLEALAMYRKGFLDGLEVGLKAEKRTLPAEAASS